MRRDPFRRYRCLEEQENAFGLGVLSTLYFTEYLSVHSGNQAFNAAMATIIRGDAIEVYPEPSRVGTEIRSCQMRCAGVPWRS